MGMGLHTAARGLGAAPSTMLVKQTDSTGDCWAYRQSLTNPQETGKKPMFIERQNGDCPLLAGTWPRRMR